MLGLPIDGAIQDDIQMVNISNVLNNRFCCMDDLFYIADNMDEGNLEERSCLSRTEGETVAEKAYENSRTVK